MVRKWIAITFCWFFTCSERCVHTNRIQTRQCYKSQCHLRLWCIASLPRAIALSWEKLCGQRHVTWNSIQTGSSHIMLVVLGLRLQGGGRVWTTNIWLIYWLIDWLTVNRADPVETRWDNVAAASTIQIQTPLNAWLEKWAVYFFYSLHLPKKHIYMHFFYLFF